jgi:Holliday junction resolvase RusA-like endonuclease
MRTYKITIPGAPVVTPRPRVLRNGTTYTPAKAKKKQMEIAETWRERYKIKLSGAVEIKVYFFFTPPKSWSKRKQRQALDGIIYPISHSCGDIDNLLKTALDGLNNVAYKDDSQVIKVVAGMEYSKNARTEIVLNEIETEVN